MAHRWGMSVCRNWNGCVSSPTLVKGQLDVQVLLPGVSDSEHKKPEYGDRGLPTAGYAISTGRPDTDAYDAGWGAHAAQKSGWL